MNSQQQIKLGAVLSYFAILVNIVTGLLYTPWMIRCIGREEFGLYTLAMSVISLFVFDFGLSSAVTRFISKYLAKGEEEKANNFLGLVYKLYLGIDVLLFVVLVGVYFFIPQIYKELTPDEIEKFKIVYAMAACYSVFSFPFIPVNGVLTSYEKFIQLKLCDVFHKLVIVVTMSVCLLLGYGLYALVMVNALSGALTIVAKLYCIKRYTKSRVNLSYSSKSELKGIASYSGWVTVKSLSQRCIMNVAPSILGMLSGSAEIAVLGIAITLEAYTFTFSNAINGMFLPKVSRNIANNVDILPLMIRIGRIQIIVIGLIVTGFVLFGNEFIHLWVGDKFKDSYMCAVLMIIPSFFHLPQEIAHQTVYAMNKVKIEAKVFILMAVVNIAGAFFFAPRFGATGIGMSICFAYFLRTIGMDIIYYRQMKLDILSFFSKSYIPFLLPLIPVLCIGILIDLFFPIHGWIGLSIQVVLYSIVYCLIVYSIFMNKSERNLILSPINKVTKNQ